MKGCDKRSSPDECQSDDFAPEAYGGPSTAGLFELKKPVQYLFRTTGRAKLARGSQLRTTLKNLATGKALEVAGADAGDGMEVFHNILTSGSLLLQPGLYSWISEIRPVPNDAIDEVGINFTVADSPEAIQTNGLRDAFSLISNRAGRNVFARGEFTALIGDQERLAAQLTVTDLTTNQQFSSPVIELIGPTDRPVDTGVVPYVISGDHVYRARLRIDYSGAGKVACSLRHRWDHE